MKKTFTLFTLLVGAASTMFAQSNLRQQADAVRVTSDPEVTTTITNTFNDVKSMTSFAPGDTVYSQNFGTGIPAGWVQSGTNKIWKVTMPPYASSGCFSTGTVALNSTTAANGMLTFDADSLQKIAYPTCTSVPCVAYDGAITSAPIDLSLYANVKLRLQQRFRVCCQGATQFLKVSISSDGGTTWTDYDAKHGVGLNQYSVTNPDPIEINISSSAGGKSAVLLKLTMTTDCGAYFWQVDDIAIVTPFTNDLQLAKSFVDMSYVNGGYYTQIPKVHGYLTPMSFRGAVYNNGTVAQSNVVVNTIVKQGATTVFNNNSPAVGSLAISVKDTQSVASSYTPNAVGTYTVTTTAQQTETEGFTPDNSIAKTFLVTDTVYARDDTSATPNNSLLPQLKQGYILVSGTTLTPSNYIGGNVNEGGLGNLYETYMDDKATSITFYLASNTGVGASLMAGLYLVPYYNPIPNIAQAESDIYDVVDATYAGKWVTLPLITGDMVMHKDSTYIVGVRNFNEATTTQRMRIGTDLFTEQPNATSWVFYQNTSAVMTWGWISVNPRIRLNTDISTSVEALTGNNGLTLYQNIPNPSNGSTRINYDLNKTSNVTFEVRDIAGQLVYSVDKGSQSVGFHSIDLDKAFSAGVYFYTLKANETSLTKKMIVTQ